jgi:hypothetical protein
LGWCSQCECYCGDTLLYHGRFCDEKHNVEWNKAIAWFIIVTGLLVLVWIFVHGALAEGSTNLQEHLLRVVLQRTRPTIKLKYPEGARAGEPLQLIEDEGEPTDSNAGTKPCCGKKAVARASLRLRGRGGLVLTEGGYPRVYKGWTGKTIAAYAPESTEASLLPRYRPGSSYVAIIDETTERLPKHEPLERLSISGKKWAFRKWRQRKEYRDQNDATWDDSDNDGESYNESDEKKERSRGR